MITFSKKELVTLFNIMAKFLAIIKKSGQTEEDLSISSIYSSVEPAYKGRLDTLFENTKNSKNFIVGLNTLYNETKSETSERQPCIAYAICIWLDKRFTYDYDDKMISLRSLVNLGTGQIVVRKSFNSNYRETGIWINPKLAVHKTKKEGKEDKPEGVTNRTTWTGINCALHNVAYFEWNGSMTIKNIIIPDGDFQDNSGTVFTVAFSPLTSEKDLVDVKLYDKDYHGGKTRGARLKLKKDFSDFSKRIEADLISAARQGVDVFFMPEMLGTEELCGKDNKGKGNKIDIGFIRQVSNKVRELGLKLPSIIVLPSYWNNGSNSATIVSNTGVVLGVQEKHVPFAYIKDKWVEDLNVKKTKEMIIIHVRNAERLSVIICSEYLKDDTYNWSDVLCRSLGVTHILVPSYSLGESAFIKKLACFRATGTSVTWGNCCGAIESDSKGIGGCSIAELNVDDIFGAVSKCQDNNCSGVRSCLFVERLALNRTSLKKGRPDKEHELKHIINDEDNLES